MTGLSGFAAIAATLAESNYRRYVLGNAVSLTGTWVQRVAIGWLAWELTGSGAWLGIIAFADLAPAMLVGPLGGALADRGDRLGLLKLGQSLLMLQAIVLCALTASGIIDRWSLLVVVLLGGAVIGINQPARLALVPSLVSRQHLSTAIAINSVVFNLARFLGPAIAGLLIVAGGTAIAFAVNAVSFLAFLLALHGLRAVIPDSPAKRGRGGLLGNVAEGFRYAAGHSGIAMLLIMMAILSLAVRPFIELMPGFAAAVLQGGAETLAMLSSTIGIGAVAGGVWLAQRGDSLGLTRIVLVGTTMAGVAVLGFALSRSLWTALPCVALAGFFLVICGVGVQTLLQNAVDGSMRGRVLSLYGLLFRGGPALGALAMGAASEFAGLAMPLVFGCLASTAIALLAWRRLTRASLALEGSS
jgi:predicted MFS family arabinose efflux permease